MRCASAKPWLAKISAVEERAGYQGDDGGVVVCAVSDTPSDTQDAVAKIARVRTGWTHATVCAIVDPIVSHCLLLRVRTRTHDNRRGTVFGRHIVARVRYSVRRHSL
jgi:hypothetical protein